MKENDDDGETMKMEEAGEKQNMMNIRAPGGREHPGPRWRW